MENKLAEVKWWEKTVEYNFVLAAKDEFGLNLLAPFDGNVESIGDAVVGADSKFFIIEFKRTLSDFKSETDKYINGDHSLKEARIHLSQLETSKYHYVIAGEYNNEAKKLRLNIRRYFNVDEEIILNSHEYFDGGMSIDELNIYTELLTAFKNRDDSDDDSGSSGSGGMSHSSVLAVDTNKKGTVISLNYYAKLKLNKKRKYTFGG
ncbi:MAG: hypothetical protein E6X23_18800 [Mixta calida]|uniref:hypothetical protein n=1 Tax=Mixta calida TaxID=665913 RepID=UPI002907CB77|nr:hypothetical protein [Mixta calida]MDU4943559.1 hypothetical protein [Mixta calida]